MSNEEKQSTEDELLAWKIEREKRKRERQREQQQDEAGDGDDFAALARALSSDDQNRYIDGVDESKENAKGDDLPFVPLAKRKRLEKEALIGRMAHRRRHIGMMGVETENGAKNNIENGNEAKGKKNTDNSDSDQDEDEDEDEDKNAGPKKIETLLDSVTALQESLTEAERAEKSRKEEESRIMKEASKVQTNALQAASELAKGIQYTDSMPSSWTCPRYILDQGKDAWEKIRKEWHMEVEGVDVPPPCKRFVDMKFAPPILEVLKRKGIKRPTPIQMQGLTVVRSDTDYIIVSSSVLIQF